MLALFANDFLFEVGSCWAHAHCRLLHTKACNCTKVSLCFFFLGGILTCIKMLLLQRRSHAMINCSVDEYAVECWSRIAVTTPSLSFEHPTSYSVISIPALTSSSVTISFRSERSEFWRVLQKINQQDTGLGLIHGFVEGGWLHAILSLKIRVFETSSHFSSCQVWLGLRTLSKPTLQNLVPFTSIPAGTILTSGPFAPARIFTRMFGTNWTVLTGRITAVENQNNVRYFQSQDDFLRRTNDCIRYVKRIISVARFHVAEVLQKGISCSEKHKGRMIPQLWMEETANPWVSVCLTDFWLDIPKRSASPERLRKYFGCNLWQPGRSQANCSSLFQFVDFWLWYSARLITLLWRPPPWSAPVELWPCFSFVFWHLFL